jgi:hypothetical protein
MPAAERKQLIVSEITKQPRSVTELAAAMGLSGPRLHQLTAEMIKDKTIHRDEDGLLHSGPPRKRRQKSKRTASAAGTAKKDQSQSAQTGEREGSPAPMSSVTPGADQGTGSSESAVGSASPASVHEGETQSEIPDREFQPPLVPSETQEAISHDEGEDGMQTAARGDESATEPEPGTETDASKDSHSDQEADTKVREGAGPTTGEQQSLPQNETDAAAEHESDDRSSEQVA